jgi:capsid protein
MQESPVIPHYLAQYFWPTVAGILAILGWIGGWQTRRKREPVEIAKLHAEITQTHAETRQINVNTDMALIQAATIAITKAERLQSERDHWERKATDLMLDLEDSRNANSEKDIRLKLHEYQTKRLKGLLDAHSISFSEIDKPRSSD